MRKEKITARRERGRSPDYRIVKIRTEGKVGVAKTVFIGVLILLQLALVITLYVGFIAAFRWYMLPAFILSLICCLHVLSSDKNGQEKAIWLLFLTVFYYFGFIAYIIASDKFFFGRAQKRFEKIYSRSAHLTPAYMPPEGVSPQVERDMKYLYEAGGFVPYRARSEYFPSGAKFFDDVIEELKKAEKFIFIEFFIISDGVLFNRVADILCRKAREGVEVRIIRDGFGSHGTLSGKNIRRLKEAGVKINCFNPLPLHFSFALNLRDHRKIIVIDGKTAYTGGCNLADEYINEKRMHGYWKDAGIRTEGAATDGFTLTFLRQWEFVTKKQENYSPYLGLSGEIGDGDAVVPYADGKDYSAAVAKGVYSNIMSGAGEKLYIMTPYFVPDEDTANLLARKALSGTDVRIVLPAVPDKPYVYSVSVDNAERLIPSGVKVYKMKHAFVHSKVVASEFCAAVGSVNIDLRSYYNQFENGVYTDDKKVMKAVFSDFANTFDVCEQITEQNSARKKFSHRLVTSLLRLFAPLM